MTTKIVKKMLLVGLLLCVGGGIHPAAAPDDSSDDVDIAQRFAPGGFATNDDFEQLPCVLQNKILGGLLRAHGDDVQEAFFYAVRNNLLWAIQPLLDEGADLTVHSYDGTALIIAACRGQFDMVALLTSLKKPIFNSFNQPQGFLFGKLPDFQWIDSLDMVHMTALAHAAHRGDIEMVKLLLDRNAAIDLSDRVRMTALAHAAHRGDIEMVKLLLDRNASIDSVNIDSKTVLMHAVHNGHTAIVEALIAAKAKLENVDDPRRMTALMYAVLNGHTAIVEALIAAKAQLEVGDERGKTVLIMAVENDDSATVRVLINAGARVDTYNKVYALFGYRDKTALMLAAQRGNMEIIRLLINGHRKQLAQPLCFKVQDLERKIQHLCGSGRTQLTIPNDSNGNRAAFEQLPNEWLQLMTEYLPLSALTNLRRSSRSCSVISQYQFGKQFKAYFRGKFYLELEEQSREFVAKEIDRAHLPNPLVITPTRYYYWQVALGAARAAQASDADIAALAPASKADCAIA